MPLFANSLWGFESELQTNPMPCYYRATACNATHGIAVAIMSVRLSVCLSVRQMRVL